MAATIPKIARHLESLRYVMPVLPMLVRHADKAGLLFYSGVCFYRQTQ